MVDPNLTWADDFFEKLTTSRLAELLVHKPGEGLALSLLATALTPVRWLVGKVTEAYYKMLMPMRKHGMVPGHSFSAAALGWRAGVLPDRFYDMVDRGSIVLRRCGASFGGFRAGGVVLDGGAGGERVPGAPTLLYLPGMLVRTTISLDKRMRRSRLVISLPLILQSECAL